MSHGARNLNRNSEGESTGPVAPDEPRRGLEFELDSVGYTFRRGHRIALCVSPAYWPTTWYLFDMGLKHTCSAGLGGWGGGSWKFERGG